jgi:hypothetical protein
VEELEQALTRRLPETTPSEELSEKESVRKANKDLYVHYLCSSKINLNIFWRSGSSLQRTKQESILANVFSPVVEHVRDPEGTTTSNTFSNLVSFSNNTTTTASNNTNNTNNTTATFTSTNNNNNTNTSNPPASPPNEKEEEFVVCHVCHSKSSTASSSESSTGERVQPTNDLATQSTSPNVVEEAIANLAALSGSERAGIESKSPSRRAYLIREESKQRIGKVMEALSAGTMHALNTEETNDDEKRDDDDEKIPAEDVQIQEETKEDQRNEEGEVAYPRQLQQQQHSHNTIDRPLHAHFASEFPSRGIAPHNQIDKI